jgi:hypothetical protein
VLSSDDFGRTAERDDGCHVLWQRFKNEQLLQLTDGARRHLWARVEEFQLIVVVLSVEASKIGIRSLGVERDAPCRRSVRQGGQQFRAPLDGATLADLLLGHGQSLRIEVPGEQGEGAEFRLLVGGPAHL